MIDALVPVYHKKYFRIFRAKSKGCFEAAAAREVFHRVIEGGRPVDGVLGWGLGRGDA
jgi:hypothetical protein